MLLSTSCALSTSHCMSLVPLSTTFRAARSMSPMVAEETRPRSLSPDMSLPAVREIGIMIQWKSEKPSFVVYYRPWPHSQHLLAYPHFLHRELTTPCRNILMDLHPTLLGSWTPPLEGMSVPLRSETRKQATMYSFTVYTRLHHPDMI